MKPKSKKPASTVSLAEAVNRHVAAEQALIDALSAQKTAKRSLIRRLGKAVTEALAEFNQTANPTVDIGVSGRRVIVAEDGTVTVILSDLFYRLGGTPVGTRTLRHSDTEPAWYAATCTIIRRHLAPADLPQLNIIVDRRYFRRQPP